MAYNQGGAIKYSLKRPIFYGNGFSTNNANYGKEIASYPIRINMISSSYLFVIANVTPNLHKNMVSQLNFELLDYDNQTVNDNSIGYFEPSEKNQSILQIFTHFQNFSIISG